jgi:TPR repeat protein
MPEGRGCRLLRRDAVGHGSADGRGGRVSITRCPSAGSFARHRCAADLAVLQARATAGNARALELLAWAELVGVGVARDPVQAYFLYGRAAAAGAPTGRSDQTAIYNGLLTPEERQQILVIETGKLARDKE